MMKLRSRLAPSRRALSSAMPAWKLNDPTLAHPHEPLTAQQIVLLSDSLPQTADAEIDYLAFMNAFEVVDTTHFEGEGRLEA